ncbi:hypothetical protein [Pelotalea chapellei]|uniref:Uncharacterized protein n=1 Tax=Pelotalea chapellei TaxID=44671 RepID=A0ABS5U408_9BACT|nr:hypothetical protein [Pelotalea chapellei]MBT1070411.1 hypothetical protein [Pelotalea chapellei]
MKYKIIVVFSFVLLGAGTAFGAAGKVPTKTDDGGTKDFTFKPSNNVTVAYSVDAGTSAQKYAVVAKNKAGNRFIGSGNDSSNLYFIESADYVGKDATDTVATTAIGTAGVLTSTGWTSQ